MQLPSLGSAQWHHLQDSSNVLKLSRKKCVVHSACYCTLYNTYQDAIDLKMI